MYDFVFVLMPKYMPFLLGGAITTIQISVLSMACAIVIGLTVALGRLSRMRVLRAVLATYVEIWRNVPLIVQLLVIYFSLPQIGVSLPGFWAGVLGLSLNVGAYLSEVFRAAILSVDAGQKDAGLSIGMSRIMIYRRVILPQALRIAIPTIGGYFIALLKDSALVSYIAVNELLRHGTIVISNTFKSMEIYIMVAIIYFVISFICARIVGYMERSLTPAYLRAQLAQS
uniref:amino acid ABC transporter permease n=1 Tax=Aminobacter niigataensis TaxID=83265 RepID=UPI00285266D7|nr:amino acid ABC transporter permease [Aminobacter niigataensis]WMD00135.1 amino acid ABC transporter permease [Aminobacter niigataensis]